MALTSRTFNRSTSFRTLVLPDCRWLQPPAEAARLNARLLQGRSRGEVICLLVTGKWCVTSLVCQNSVPHMCVHHLWPALQCSISGLRSIPVLCWRRLRLGRAVHGTRPGEPRRICPRQWPCHTGIQLACAYSCTSGPGLQYSYYAQHPFPHARCSWARGRSQTRRLRPSAPAHGLRRFHGQNQPQLGT